MFGSIGRRPARASTVMVTDGFCAVPANGKRRQAAAAASDDTVARVSPEVMWATGPATQDPCPHAESISVVHLARFQRVSRLDSFVSTIAVGNSYNTDGPAP